MSAPDTIHSRPSLRGMFAAAAAIAVFVATLGAPVAASAAAPQIEETAHTNAAVIAVDDHWLDAEVSGDTAWLDAMLLPDYRSISSDGKTVDKQKILAGAARNRGSDKMRKQVEAWQKAHPTKTSVVMHGNVAILSFSDPNTGRVRSSDIFIYKGGAWHALYSQHAKVE